MLSKEYRLKVTEIACKIKLQKEVTLCDMVWYNKIIKYNAHARGIHERTVISSS